jgi:hypothetical protein
MKKNKILNLFICFILLLTLSSCGKNQYRIKVYDADTKKEVKKFEKYDYTGEEKQFDIVVLRNGKEFYTITLHNLIEKERVKILTVWSSIWNPDTKDDDQGYIYPIQRGSYHYSIEFNGLYQYDGKCLFDEDTHDYGLYFYIDYDYVIEKVKESNNEENN